MGLIVAQKINKKPFFYLIFRKVFWLIEIPVPYALNPIFDSRRNPMF